jgi:hypothetical protein
VPLTESLSGFFSDEYERFMRGLGGLGGVEAERRRARAARDGRTQDRGREISIPRWDDVVHVRPGTTITSEQYREWRSARARGGDPNLTPEVTSALDRRAARSDAMRNSTQPEYAQSYGSMMTALDNVQDLLASISILGRLALKYGPMIGVRAIPGLGTAKNAADLLNILNALAQLGLPLFALICHGPKDFLAAGLGTGLTRAVFKGGISALARTDPRAMRWRWSNTGRIAAKMVFIGQALTVAQTTDQLFGYGISLGPIVGGILEGAYALELISRGEQVGIHPGPDSAEMRRRMGPRLQREETWALRDKMAAAAVLHAAPAIHRTQDIFTPDEHLLALCALPPAIETLRRDLRGVDWWPGIPAGMGYRPPPPQNVAHRAPWWLLRGENPPLDGWGWPIPGHVADATLEQIAADTAAEVPAALGRVLAHFEHPTLRTFAGAVIAEATESLWLFLTDDPHALQATMAPDVIALERMAQVNLLPFADTPLDKLEPFWREAIRLVDEHKRELHTRESWLKLGRRFGVDLVLAIPPDVDHTLTAPPAL